jgi:hypothetical protein
MKLRTAIFSIVVVVTGCGILLNQYQYYNYDDGFQIEAVPHNGEIYFPIIYLGNPWDPYTGKPVISFITPESDTVRTDMMDMNWITTHIAEMLFSPLRDTFYYRTTKVLGKTVEIPEAGVVGGTPVNYRGWSTKKIRIFTNPCWGLEVITMDNKPVYFQFWPSRTGLPWLEGNPDNPKETNCTMQQLYLSNEKMKAFFQLPFTSAQIERIYGKPSKIHSVYK